MNKINNHCYKITLDSQALFILHPNTPSLVLTAVRLPPPSQPVAHVP